jgi:hypothetical protein
LIVQKWNNRHRRCKKKEPQRRGTWVNRAGA